MWAPTQVQTACAENKDLSLDKICVDQHAKHGANQSFTHTMGRAMEMREKAANPVLQETTND
jgi:hypothetical protein